MSTPFLKYLILGILIACSASCATKAVEKEANPEYMVDISEFKIDTTAIKDNERIEILCASDQLFPSDEVDYYIHAVAVSLETGDTVNILTTGLMSLNNDNRITEFHSAESDVAKIFQNINQIETGVNVKDLESNKLTKVFSDPEFITLETSHFPSIIGLVGGTWNTPGK